MKLTVDAQKAVPVYEQIMKQIEGHILSGGLRPGDALPSVRQLATDLELNPNTVAKAYQLLERQNIIITAGRKGSFVSKQSKQSVLEARELTAEKRIQQLLDDLRNMGLRESEIKTLFKEAMSL